MVIIIAEGTRTGRKPHRCFHCQRPIPSGVLHGFQTNKYDHVYTLRWHLDCEDLAAQCRDASDYEEEGWSGLRDEWCESGEYLAECNYWRGFYPHVIARMELTDQLNPL